MYRFKRDQEVTHEDGSSGKIERRFLRMSRPYYSVYWNDGSVSLVVAESFLKPYNQELLF